MGRLEGKVVLITGSGSGIGRAAAILFGGEKGKVIVVDWNAEGGQETVRMIRENGGIASFVRADVSNAADVEIMVRTRWENHLIKQQLQTKEGSYHGRLQSK